MLSTLVYSTYLGGSITDSNLAIAADAAGNTYVTGSTASADFPTTSGAFDRLLNGVYDAFVAKFRPDGSLAWSTLLGGDGDERGHGIAIDSLGNVFVTGRTDSVNFPTSSASLSKTLKGGVDAFVTKLNANGTALVYSTYLGGTGHEIDQGFDKLARRVGAIAVDGSGQAYITGSTTSVDFPTTAGAFRTSAPGFIDAFVTKLNATGSALVYSTYLGGDDIDRSHGIAVDGAGNAYVMGEVVSTNFPTTVGAFQRLKAGGFSDIFVAKLNAAGTGLVYSTYLGGLATDAPGRLALDSTGQVYLTGATASFDFPTSSGAYQTTKASGGTYDAFVTKLNAAGSSLVYSTYFGGTFGNDFGEGIAVTSGSAYITGSTTSLGLPVSNAFQPSPNGLSEAFVAQFNATGSALIFSTYFGGDRNDYSYGIALDGSQTAHIAGQTLSASTFTAKPFPTTDGAFQPTINGSPDAYVARIRGATPPPPSNLSISDVSRIEGHSSTTPFIFAVTLSAPSSQMVTVQYSTADATATIANRDYQSQIGSLTFAPGETSKSLSILVNGDRRGEKNETFFVNLSSAVNALIADGQAVGTIVDDEPRISVSNVARLEGQSGATTLFTFIVSLSAPYDQPVTMSFQTVDRSASASDGDYIPQTGTLTFNPGELTKTVVVAVLGDSKKEVNELYYLELFGKSSNSVYLKKRGVGTIQSDD